MEGGGGRASAESSPAAHPHQPVAWFCQVCRARLIITGSVEGAAPVHGSPGALSPSGAGPAHSSPYEHGGKIDESFIVLDDRKPGAPPAAARGLEESFVVLSSASVMRGPGRLGQPGPSGQPSSQPPPPQPPPQPPPPPEGSAVPGLDAKLQALAQLFELAATATHVDHPLCLDCAQQLREEVESQIQEAEREISCYAAAVSRLEAEQQGAGEGGTSGPGGTPSWAPLPEAEFQRQMAALKAEEEEQRAKADAVEAEVAGARAELAALQAVAADLDSLEERYWHDFNEHQLLLRQHVEERDGLVARIARAQQRRQLLSSTNVYNDAFKIWHDGCFGTISGFRLGRTPDHPVEWDEINAAWGQAVLLLFTMAQASGVTFRTARLLPMGSHPRVADKRGTYDLFGPVSKLWSANYDKAMVCYLGCLAEFGAHARATDEAAGVHIPFNFPFIIDGDKVNGHTIKLTLNKDARWTKALKFMLADLKVALQWMVRYTAMTRNTEMAQQMTALGPEGPSRS